MKGRTKVAVVGVWALGSHHARIYAANPGCELVGVVDINENRVHEIAGLYGCEAWTHFSQAVGRVEAVSLAVPTVLHREIGACLLEEGVHVLVEKPVAHSLEAADALIEAQRSSGCVLHVGHSERFNPAVIAVRPWVTDPRFFEAHRLGVFVPRSLDIDVVLDLMIHDLDLILHFVDSPILEIRAVGIPILTPRIDIANVRIQFENGCVANITASRVSSEKTRKLRFFQPHDYVSIDFQQRKAKMCSLVEGDSGRNIIPRDLEISPAEPLAMEIEAFLEAVSGREAALDGCTGEEGKAALSLALRLLEEMDIQEQDVGSEGSVKLH